MQFSASQDATSADAIRSSCSKDRCYFDEAADIEFRSLSNDRDDKNGEKIVVWLSEDFGRQRIGRFRLERGDSSSFTWTWIITVPVVKASIRRGSRPDLREAVSEFRKAFADFSNGVTKSQWEKAFELAKRARQRFNIR